jgi:hypothetical protein
MAVLVTVMFEVWSEGKAPPYSPMTTSLKPGTPDLLGISWFRYGGKTGIRRLMKILDDTEIKATICLNAKAAELYPDAVKELHRRGHEIAGHSYTQDLVLPYLSPEEESHPEMLANHRKRRGNRPVGWFSPSPLHGAHGRILAEAGISGMETTTIPTCPTRYTLARAGSSPSPTATSPTTALCAAVRETFTTFTKTPSTISTSTKPHR